MLGLAACGGSNDDADAERSVNERIEQERAEAASDARQEERIRELEEEAREARRRARRRDDAASPAPAAPPPSAPSTPPTGGGGDWPGGSAYTAILASVRSEAEARALQSQATERGLDAGVLHSSDFRSLRPGYWVVFSGSFPSQADAARRTSRAKELGYGQSYPRLVSP